MKKVLFVVLAALMLLSTAVYADPIEIIYWSARSGEAGEFLQKTVDEFNASQDKYFVNLTYTGGYEDTLAKFQASAAGSRPDLVELAAEHMGFFPDNPDFYVPVQQFIDEEGYDTSDIMPNLVNNLTNAEGQIMGIPSANSQAGYFYNTKMLKDAGVDPETDLNSFEQIAEVAEKLQAAGVKYPLYVDDDSPTYDALLVAQGYELIDQNNGKDARCTRSLIGDEPLLSSTKKFFTLIHDMQAKGQLAPLGQSGNDYRTMFVNGELGIFIWTIASYSTIGEMANWDMEFGFQPAGTFDAGAKNYGQMACGGNIFIGNNNDPERARGAWEMMKVLLTPEYTSQFSMLTGYLPTTTSGYETEAYQTFLKEKAPSLVKCHEAQQNTEPGIGLGWMPMFGDFDEIIRGMIVDVIEDPSYDPEQAAIDLAERTDEAIELYNMSKQ